jgi:hypothetical protein
MFNLHHTLGQTGRREASYPKWGGSLGTSGLSTIFPGNIHRASVLPCESWSRLKLTMSDTMCRDRIKNA